MTRRSILIAAGLPLVASAAAQASFVNAPIRLEYVARDGLGAFDTFAAGTEVAVDELGTAVEFPAFLQDGPTFDVDVDAATIRVDHFYQPVVDTDWFANAPFLGLVLSDASNAVPPIESVTVVPSLVAMPGLVVTHDDDVIELNWAGLLFTPLTRIDLAVTFADEVPPEPVPEPAAGVAGGAALTLLAVLRRNRRSTILA